MKPQRDKAASFGQTNHWVNRYLAIEAEMGIYSRAFGFLPVLLDGSLECIMGPGMRACSMAIVFLPLFSVLEDRNVVFDEDCPEIQSPWKCPIQALGAAGLFPDLAIL